MMKKYTSVAEYFGDHSGVHLEILEKIKRIILSEAPQAEEVISYGMPAFKLGKIIAGVSAYKHHVSFYPFEGSLVSKYKKKLKGFKCLKGTIQIDINKEFPEDVIREIVKDKLKLITES